MRIQQTYLAMVNAKITSKGVFFKKILTLAIVALSTLELTLVSAKDIPGASETSYGVSASGAFQFGIPIIVPQGVNGVQPNLSLSFSSRRSNGMAGVGWGVSGLGEISRCGRTIVRDGVSAGVNHDVNDRFCLNGQPLILAVGSTYGAAGTEYRTELDTFSKIVANGNGSINLNGGRAPTSFRVYRKDGGYEEYGLNGDARFALPGSSSIHSWKLARVYDRNGNYYRVKYNAVNGYPTEITYTLNNTAGLASDKKVQFVYGTRSDARYNYVAGRKITMNKRLERIRVTRANSVVRQYNLAYQQGPTSGRSRVTSVTEIGQNNQAMPPIKIVWEGTTNGFVTGSNQDKAPEGLIEYYNYQANLGLTRTYPRTKALSRGQWADMNGDGQLDLVIAYTKPNGAHVLKTYIRTPGANGGWTPMAG